MRTEWTLNIELCHAVSQQDLLDSIPLALGDDDGRYGEEIVTLASMLFEVPFMDRARVLGTSSIVRRCQCKDLAR